MGVMSRNRWRAGAVLSVTGLLVAVLSSMAVSAPAGAATAAAKRAAPAAVGGKVAVNAAAIAAYWTPARMKSARSVDVVHAQAAQLTAAEPNSPGAGTPGSVPGGLPKGASASAEAPVGDGWTGGTGSFDSFPVPAASYQKYPYKVNGKVFFKNDGVNYVCSGTVVPSASGSSNEDEVWMAGHCLTNTESLTGVIDSSLTFVPAYNGSASVPKPLGQFVWTGSWETTTSWLNSRDFSEDEAAITVKPDAKGILGNVTGWAGFAWNYSPYESFSAFGYPAAAPFNGNLMEQDWATTYELDTGVGGAGQPPMGIGSDFTGGSSGGGWMIGWTPTGPGYVDGHNDYTYGSVADTMFSPYQDSLSNQVRCFGATSC